MSVVIYNRFVALLALFALAGSVALLVPALRRRLPADAALVIALGVAVVCTGGSLIYSEYFGFEPCRLCWYQRIAMYPLVLMLGIALARKDHAIRRYAVPQAVIGGVVSAYHYTLQTFPALGEGICPVGVPCTAKYVNEFGFISIPFMALAGFSLLAMSLIAARSRI